MNKLMVVFVALTISCAAHGQREVLPNGNIIEPLGDGLTLVTIHISGRPLAFVVTPGVPFTGQFQTEIRQNLLKSDIVGAPKSMKVQIWGDCSTKTYMLMGMLPTYGEMGFGLPDSEHMTGPEQVIRNVESDSPIDKIFHLLCKQP